MLRHSLLVGSIATLWLVSSSQAQKESAANEAGFPRITEYRQLTFYRHPLDHAVFAANCEYAHLWEGELRVFHQDADKVDWLAELPKEYKEWEGGSYLHSLNWVHLYRLDLFVLEVIVSTHRGNGALFIFALEGKQLRILLRAPIMGFADQGWADAPPPLKGLPPGHTTFPEPLSVEYVLPKDGGAESVRLSGTVISRNPDTDSILGQKQITETWLWDAKDRVFHLQKSP